MCEPRNIRSVIKIPDSIMTTTIEDLLPELLVKIFSHYIESDGHMAFSRNVVPVCRMWRTLSSAPSLWKRVHLRDWNYALSLSERGVLRHTRSLKVPSSDMNYPKARKYEERNHLDPLYLLAVLPNIRDLNALEITNNAIDAHTMSIVARHCPNLESLRMKRVSRGDEGPVTIRELGPILDVCGPKLKHLSFVCCELQDSEQLITEITAKCPSLEVFELRNLYFIYQSFDIVCPIYKLINGCPRLRKLEMSDCDVVISTDESHYSGFGDLIVFKAKRCYFHGLDVCCLLKNSVNLECLELDLVDSLVFSDASKIPSNKIKFLNIQLKDLDMSLKALERVVDKWKHTLLHLRILAGDCDITSVLRIILDDNPCPKLEALWVEKDYVDLNFLEVFIQKCKNLNKLSIQTGIKPVGLKQFKNRRDVIKFRIFV